MTTPPRDYEMRISQTVVENLGIKLYDRVSAVLAELIANSYDADAEVVEIEAPLGKYLSDKNNNEESETKDYYISISDNGHGMTRDEVIDHYLYIGRNRRIDPERGDSSRIKKRKVMGRKGIGKLAPFGICKVIELYTVGGLPDEKGKYEVCHLILELDEINKASQAERNYKPKLGAQDGNRSEKTGTQILLSDFNYKKVPDLASLHRQLAARFGVTRSDWKINIKDLFDNQTHEVGQLDIELMEGTKIDVSTKPVRLPDGEFKSVTGWIGYAKENYKDDIMAGVRIFAREKIVAQTRDFNIKSGFYGEFKVKSYLVGMINADWLDEAEDLVQSHRQDILWSSEYGEALQQWGQELVKEVASKSDSKVNQKKWERFSERFDFEKRMSEMPINKELKSLIRDSAKELTKRLDEDSLGDPIYLEKIFNLAVAFAPHKQLLESLNGIASSQNDSMAPILELLSTARMAELYSLGQIAQERIDVIQSFETKIKDSRVSEMELQRLIEDAPWIVRPEWTPITMNESLSTFRRSFEAWYESEYGLKIVTSTFENGITRKRPDFIMLNSEGILEIVEIKEPKHSLGDEDWVRLSNYIPAINKFMSENVETSKMFTSVRMTIVTDYTDKLSPPNKMYLDMAIGNGTYSHKTWFGVLEDTLRAHKDFLARLKEIGRYPKYTPEDSEASLNEQPETEIVDGTTEEVESRIEQNSEGSVRPAVGDLTVL